MKKFLPFVLLTLGFSGFLIVQIVLESIDIKAGLSSKEREKLDHYRTLFSSLKLTTVENSQREFRLSELQAPVVVLNFWASWCVPCLQEFPSIVKLMKTFPHDQVTVIGINNDDENALAKISKTKQKYKLEFENVYDKDGEVTNKFGITALPVSIIYIKGEVYKVTHGAEDFSSTSLIEAFRKAQKNL